MVACLVGVCILLSMAVPMIGGSDKDEVIILKPEPGPEPTTTGYWTLYNGVNFRTFTDNLTAGWWASNLFEDIIIKINAQFGEDLTVDDVLITGYSARTDNFMTYNHWFPMLTDFHLYENQSYIITILNSKLDVTPVYYELPNNEITSPVSIDLFNGRNLVGVPVTSLTTARELALDIINYMNVTYGEVIDEEEIQIRKFDSRSGTATTCRKGAFGWVGDFPLIAEDGYWIEIDDGILATEPRSYDPPVTKGSSIPVVKSSIPSPVTNSVPVILEGPHITDVQDFSFAIAGVADVPVDAEVEVGLVPDFAVGTGSEGTYMGVDGEEDNISSGVFRIVCGQLSTEETTYHYRLKLTNGADTLYYPDPSTTISVTTGWWWNYELIPDPMYQTQDIGTSIPLPNFLYLSWVTGSADSYPLSLIDHAGIGSVCFSGENLRDSATGETMVPEAGDIWHVSTYGLWDDGLGKRLFWNDSFSESHPPGDEMLYVGWGHYDSWATGPEGVSNSLGPFNITFHINCLCFGYDDIYYSDDNNLTWNYIGTEELMGDGIYPWTAPAHGTYWWIVNGDEWMGPGYNWPAPGTPAEAGPYIIKGEYNISLNEGWNLVSSPYELTDENIDQALSSIAGQWDCVQVYDPLNPEPWKTNNTHWPIQLNEFDTLNHRQAFWINITEPGGTILSVFGLPPASTSIPLYAGWNLVGYPTLNDTRTVAEALSSTGADHVEVFDPAEPYRIKEVPPTYLMQPGEGYWIHVPIDTIWTIDW